MIGLLLKPQKPKKRINRRESIIYPLDEIIIKPTRFVTIEVGIFYVVF